MRASAEWYGSDVLVIRGDVNRLKGFFEGLGLRFVAEKHGDGPDHYACNLRVGGPVLELYPPRAE